MARQHLLAGLADLGAILLQARQHDLVALLHLRPAKPRDVAGAGVMARLLSAPRRLEDDQRPGEWRKESWSFCYAFIPGNRNRDVSITFSGEVSTGRSQQAKTGTDAEIRTLNAWVQAKLPAVAMVNALKAENACVASTQAFPGAKH